MADRAPLPTWRHVLVTPDTRAWPLLRPQLRLGQALTGTIAWTPRPGTIGIGVELGLSVGGFVDVLYLPNNTDQWPGLETITDFVIWWIDERPQIRLMPTDRTTAEKTSPPGSKTRSPPQPKHSEARRAVGADLHG